MSDGNTISARSNWLDSLILSFRIVFSKWPYLSIVTITAAIFGIVFNVFDQLLFFSPIVIFYLPDDAVMGFILSTLTSILLGIIVSMFLWSWKNILLPMCGIDIFFLRDGEIASMRTKSIGFMLQSFNLINRSTGTEECRAPCDN